TVRWSEVRYGSHSAPLMISVWTAESFGGASFTCVGNAAPPSPTTPPRCTASTTSAGVSPSQRGTSRGRATCGAYRSTLSRTAMAIEPSGCGHQSKSTTVPAADAWIGTDMNPSASPSVSPRSTWSPTFTHSSAGLPACCRIGNTSSSANGIRRIGSWFVSSFSPGGWTPCRDSTEIAIVSSVELRAALHPFLQILLLRVERRARMDDRHRTALGRGHQLLVGAGVRVLHVRLLVGVVREDLLAQIRALVAGRAARRVDVRLEHQGFVAIYGDRVGCDCGARCRRGRRHRRWSRCGDLHRRFGRRRRRPNRLGVTVA